MWTHGADKAKILYEVADLWFHSMIALSHYGLTPADVVAELERREGTSGLRRKSFAQSQKTGRRRKEDTRVNDDIVEVRG